VTKDVEVTGYAEKKWFEIRTFIRLREYLIIIVSHLFFFTIGKENR